MSRNLLTTTIAQFNTYLIKFQIHLKSHFVPIWLTGNVKNNYYLENNPSEDERNLQLIVRGLKPLSCITMIPTVVSSIVIHALHANLDQSVIPNDQCQSSKLIYVYCSVSVYNCGAKYALEVNQPISLKLKSNCVVHAFIPLGTNESLCFGITLIN